jgi:hypothetical protein
MKFIKQLGVALLASLGIAILLPLLIALLPFIRCYNDFDKNNLGRSILSLPVSLIKGVYDVVKLTTATAYNLVTGALEICIAPFVKAGLAIAYSIEKERGLGANIWAAMKGFITGPVDALCDIIAFEFKAMTISRYADYADTIAHSNLKSYGKLAAEAGTFVGSNVESSAANVINKKDAPYADIPLSNNVKTPTAQRCEAYNDHMQAIGGCEL